MSARRLRVLVIALGRRGGLNDYAWMMARALSGRCDIAVVGSAYAEDRARWAALGVDRLEVPTFNSIGGLLLSMLAWTRFWRIRRFALAFAPDVVYYPGGHAFKPLLDLFLPRSIPVVFTLHDPELHAGEDSVLHRALDRSNRRRVDGYVLLSEVQGHAFARREGLSPDRYAIVPLGSLYAGADEPLPPAASLDGAAALAGREHRYLMFVGRIERYKGIDVLLRAYARIDASIAPPLVIAGSGPLSAEENELLHALADRPVVVLPRWLDSAEIASLLSQARFAVLPYTHATQSGIVPLAAAFGVPSIVSDAGALPEQVSDGETGFVVPASDPAALATALERSIALGETEYRALCDACAARSAREWDWAVLGERLSGFLRQIAGV